MQENKPFDIFTLQRHITNDCQLRCKHCYVDFSKKQSINIDDFKKWLDNYKKFLLHYWITWKIYYTWGDPLLHERFWEIISLSKKNGLDVWLFWNFHLLNEENVQKLYDNEIKFYQLSMEWTKEVHDSIRWKWTFDWVVHAIQTLEEKWISTLVNMTLSKMNIRELVPLIEFLAYNTDLSRFDFVRVVPIWKAWKDILLTDDELKSVFLEVLKLEKKIKQDWKKLIIWKKDHLWKLLYYEAERLKINMEDKSYGHLTVIENGDIYLCRKIPIKIWNIITDDLVEIYKHNKMISDAINMRLITGCHWCKLEYVCRWCPAVTYWLSKGFTLKDPQCWQ